MTASPTGWDDPDGEADWSEPPPAALAGLRVIVDTLALAGNYRALARIAGAAECGAVVKANAYGIGVEAAGLVLARAGARSFFVATPEEGRALRAALPRVRIFILNGATGEDVPFLIAHDLVPFLSSLEEIEEIAAGAREVGHLLPVAVQVDTGMNRLGVSPAEAIGLVEGRLPDGLRPVLVASHLACGDEPANPMNRDQLARFYGIAERVRVRWPEVQLSLANSAGTLLGRQYHFDLVRPGIALYGARATVAHRPLAPVITAEARILQVRRVRAGDTVGYGAARRMERDGRIAIASAGYADGYLRALGGADARPGAAVRVGRTLCRLAGRVSMDLIAIDVTDCPEDAVERGGWVELFGISLPIDEVADAAGTIGYELLTGLSRRAPRVYLPPVGRAD